MTRAPPTLWTCTIAEIGQACTAATGVDLMDRNIFRYILRHSLRQQVVILTLTAVSFPFLYATLELPKRIINDALAGDSVRTCSASASRRSTTCSCCAASSCASC